MSLVGFKARNHRQQVGARGALDAVDERFTPDWLYQDYDRRFNFTLDAAASSSNRKTVEFFSIEDNGLAAQWAPHRVWCNPPYSNLGAWAAKAHAEYRAGCPVIVMLLPANRTEQGWWQEHIEPFRDRSGWLSTEFLPRRINFGAPGNEAGKYHSSAPFGCVAVIWQAAAGGEG